MAVSHEKEGLAAQHQVNGMRPVVAGRESLDAGLFLPGLADATKLPHGTLPLLTHHRRKGCGGPMACETGTCLAGGEMLVMTRWWRPGEVCRQKGTQGAVQTERLPWGVGVCSVRGVVVVASKLYSSRDGWGSVCALGVVPVRLVLKWRLLCPLWIASSR